MKSVLFFVTNLDSGGLENYLLRFLQYKVEEFAEVEVYCKSGRGGQLESDYLKLPNVRITKRKLGYFNISSYLALKTYLEKGKYDVICDFTGNFAGLPLLVGKYAGVKNRTVFYRGAADHFKTSFIKVCYNNWVKKLTYNNATYILSNSKAAFDYFYKDYVVDDRFHVIYNGIDASKFEIGTVNLREELGIPDKVFVIGHTGRFNYAKNHNVIIEVADKLLAKYSDIYFILCGNGVKENLNGVINSKGVANRILLFENRRDIPCFLNTMDAYIFPSITEGQPNALIEAMIMGLPFVASDIEPIKETVDMDSLLFAPDDTEGFFRGLEMIYLKGKVRNEDLKERTMDKFNYKNRFNEFYNILIK